MKIKNFICFMLCSVFVCCTACSSEQTVETIYMSDVTSPSTQHTSSDSTTTEVEDTSSAESLVSDTSSEQTPSSEVESDVESVTDTSEPEDEDPKDPFTGKDFTFTAIKDVNYFCVKNLQGGNAIYAITEIIADNDDDISIGCQVYCDDPTIKTEKRTVTIPYEYKASHKSVNLYAKHSITGIRYDFIIEFGNEWKLVLEDQFEGSEMNTDIWAHRPEMYRDKGYVNYFSHDMTFVDGNGNLVSRAQEGKKKVWDYTNKCYKEVDAYLSGAVSTKGLYEATYGYFEARVKLHHQTGMWGAFWLVAGDMDDSNPADDNSSENGCEIDVFESIYQYGGVSQNLHWDGFTGHTVSAPSASYVTQIDTFDDEYHTFAISWTPNEYIFLVDGVITRRINATTAHGICNQPAYMLITTECGIWAGKWVLQEGEYSDMLVDYVRVYEYTAD